jgi:hypothetical protein
MNQTNQIQMLLSSLMMQLPLLLVCLAAVAFVLVRWKQASRGAIWALLGFGLALVLCLAIPLVQTAVQQWVMQGGNVAHRAGIFGGLSLVWSVLRAASYALLLVAVFAGRATPQAVAPPPLIQGENPGAA